MIHLTLTVAGLALFFVVVASILVICSIIIKNEKIGLNKAIAITLTASGICALAVVVFSLYMAITV
jgi:hypothetical protein